MPNGISRYTNADAARYLPGRTSQDIVKPIIPEEELTGPIDIDNEPEPSVEALLDAARGQLSHSGQMSRYYDTERLGALPASLEALRNGNELPGVMEAAQTVGRGLQTASLPLSLFPPTAPVGAMGLAAGSALALPEDVRQLVAPEEDETRLGGAFETGLDLLGAAPAVRALRTASQMRNPFAATHPRVLGGPKQATEIPFASKQVATNPNQALATAREVSSESGDPLEKVLTGARRSGKDAGFTKQAADALRRLANAGKAGRSSRASRDNAIRNAPFGEGSLMPSAMNPSEMRYPEFARTNSQDALNQLLNTPSFRRLRGIE